MFLQRTLLAICFLFSMMSIADAFLSQKRIIETASSTSATATTTPELPRFPLHRLFSSSSATQNDENPTLESPKNATAIISTKSETEASSALSQALILQQQAQKLRDEANAQAKALQEEKDRKVAEQNRKIDRWIEELLIQYQVDEDTQLLHTVDQVLCRLRDDRYSHEQVNKIFKRICETGPPQSRSRCSPIMELFVDAVGKLDEVERAENPNKRWSGKAERELRKKLFAMDWGIELPDENEEGNPWKL